GIRDKLVTGVQTCALPISGNGAVAGFRTRDRHVMQFFRRPRAFAGLDWPLRTHVLQRHPAHTRNRRPRRARRSAEKCSLDDFARSEERRVGKEWRSWWARG